MKTIIWILILGLVSLPMIFSEGLTSSPISISNISVTYENALQISTASLIGAIITLIILTVICVFISLGWILAIFSLVATTLFIFFRINLHQIVVTLVYDYRDRWLNPFLFLIMLFGSPVAGYFMAKLTVYLFSYQRVEALLVAAGVFVGIIVGIVSGIIVTTMVRKMKMNAESLH